MAGIITYVPGCRPEPPDAISAKQLHLTYAGLHRGELQFDTILTTARRWAQTRGGLLEYVIGREKHNEPAHPDRDEHFHIFLHFGKKVCSRNRRLTTIFDLSGRNSRVLHPEIQSVGRLPGDRQRVIEYDIKEGDYVGELRTPLVGGPMDLQRVAGEGEDSDDVQGNDDEVPPSPPKPAWAHRLKQAASVRDGMQRLFEETPEIYFTAGGRIAPMLAQAVGSPDEKLVTLEDFRRPALDLSRPVVLHGKTNTGKSEFAQAHFDAPLVVRTRDDLKRATFHCDGIIFDDFDFDKWKPEEVIHLLEYTKNRSIPARYTDAQIEAFTPMIFTTNRRPKDLFPYSENREQRRAIRRRHRRVRVREPLMRLGRPFTAAELQARRSAGRNGPRGPAADRAERELFG